MMRRSTMRRWSSRWRNRRDGGPETETGLKTQRTQKVAKDAKQDKNQGASDRLQPRAADCPTRSDLTSRFFLRPFALLALSRCSSVLLSQRPHRHKMLLH